MQVAEPNAPPETPREITEPYTAAGGEQEPSDYLYPYYPYSGGFRVPFILGHPRPHHGHHHGHSSLHGAVTPPPGHGVGHGGHRSIKCGVFQVSNWGLPSPVVHSRHVEGHA